MEATHEAYQDRRQPRGCLENIDAFDAEFFSISRREAEFLNPQHRAFLECAWHALEDAGCDVTRSEDVVAIYATCGANSYEHLAASAARSPAEQLLAYISNAVDFLPTRVSYKLNLRGESIAVQTACSSSLVAIHLACRSLLDGNCNIALAGGANIAIPGRDEIEHQEGMIFSADGRCRSFDQSASGMVAADGVGVVVLKRLSEALADGDHIYGVIRGSALNNDGAEKISFPAPSIGGQSEVIASALALAGVSASDIGYLEAHGTGTRLGDPIEIEALTRAYRLTTERTGYCALGTVKTNIGHAIHSAGVAGFIRATLALHKREIPASLHFETANPEIDFERSPFYVNTVHREWGGDAGRKRRAGVSSFGVGGTNAHVILEEAPARVRESTTRPAHLLTLSARTRGALAANVDELATYLHDNPQLPLDDVAYTLQAGRRHFPYRKTVVCRGTEDAVAGLRKQRGDDPDVPRAEAGKVAFAFPGLGSQHNTMGRELYRTHRKFRRTVDRLCGQLEEPIARTIGKLLSSGVAENETPYDDPLVAHSAIFILEYALACLWRSWGVEPAYLVGHSVGEYTAACLAEVFSPEDALLLVSSRARMMSKLPTGAMLALPLSAGDAEALLPEQCWVAISNGPTFTVVAGATPAIAELERRARERRIFTSRIATKYAVHTPLVTPIENEFSELLAGIKMKPPKFQLLSGSTGEWLTSEQVQSRSYWASHLSRPVLFSKAVDVILQERNLIVLEVGPSRVLTGLMRLHPRAASEHSFVASLPQPQSGSQEWPSLMQAVGDLWVQGVAVDWQELHAEERRFKVPLPGYAFQRQRHWVAADGRLTSNTKRNSGPAARKLPDVSSWLYRPAWSRSWLPPAYDDAAPVVGGGVCLIITRDAKDVADIEFALRSAGDNVAVVAFGGGTPPASRYNSLSAQGPEDFSRLLGEISQDLGDVRSIVFWAASEEAPRSPDGARVAHTQLLWLTQALAGQTSSPDLWIVTRGAQSIPQIDREVDADGALLMGFARVISQEFPRVRTRCVDLGRQSPNPSREGLQFLGEMASAGGDDEVVYRGTDRWCCTPEALTREENLEAGFQFRAGAYVIFGGTGHVGLCFADFLSSIPGASVILAGRRSLPPVNAWEEILADRQGSVRDRGVIERLQTLRQRGGQIEYRQVNLGDPRAVLDMLREVRDHLGPLRGVIHAAGVVDTDHLRFIADTTAEIFEEILAPHHAGTQALCDAVNEVGSEFCVACSSLSSLVGGLSYGAHAAGHRAMDAVMANAAATDAKSARWLTINYDTWLVSSRQAGLGAGEADLHITPDEGVAVLRHCLASGAQQVLISTTPLSERIASLKGAFAGGDRTRDEDVESGRSPAIIDKGSEHSVREMVLAVFQDVLGDERLGAGDNFFNFGGSSLGMLDVIARINTSAGIQIPLSDGFRSLSASAMSSLVWHELRHKCDSELVSS